jgi:lipoate synthase
MSQTLDNVQYIISIALCLQYMKPQQTHLKNVSFVEFKEFHLETDVSSVRLFLLKM